MECPLLSVVAGRAGCRLHVSWGTGNELHCTSITTSQISEVNSVINCVQWGIPSAFQRRIAYDSSVEYFKLTHSLGPHVDANNKTDWRNVVDFAKALSKILYDAYATDVCTASETQESALWDLIIVLTFEAVATSAGGGREAALALPGWLVRHHPSFCASIYKAVNAASSEYEKFQDQQVPEYLPDYWPWICRLLALGYFSDALDLFALHSVWSRWEGADTVGGVEPNEVASAEIAALEAVTLLVRRFPKLKRKEVWDDEEVDIHADHVRIREFDSWEGYCSYRATWIRQCEELAADTNKLIEKCSLVAPETAKGLLTVLNILRGDINTINRVLGVKSSGWKDIWEGDIDPLDVILTNPSWVELFVARLLHVYSVEVQTLSALRQVLRDCLKDKAPNNEFEHVVAAVIDAVCDNDIPTVIRATSAVASGWFMAHLPVLLNTHPAGIGPLQAVLPQFGCKQEEFYALEHASSLALQQSLWPLAARYFILCPSHGRGAVKALVERLSPALDSMNTLKSTSTKAGIFCAEHGFSDLQSQLCIRQAVTAWQCGCTGTAMTYISKVEDQEEHKNEILKSLALSLAEMVTFRAMAAVDEHRSGHLNVEQNNNLEDILRVVEIMDAEDLMDPLSSFSRDDPYDAILRVSALVHGVMMGKVDFGDKCIQLLASLSALRREECLMYLWPCLPVIAKSVEDAQARARLLQWFQEIGEPKLLVAGDDIGFNRGSGISKFSLASGREGMLNAVRLELVHSLCGASLL